MPDRFSRFDVYWIQTDKQTDRQATYIFFTSPLIKKFQKIWKHVKVNAKHIKSNQIELKQNKSNQYLHDFNFNKN